MSNLEREGVTMRLKDAARVVASEMGRAELDRVAWDPEWHPGEVLLAKLRFSVAELEIRPGLSAPVLGFSREQMIHELRSQARRTLMGNRSKKK